MQPHSVKPDISEIKAADQLIQQQKTLMSALTMLLSHFPIDHALPGNI
jgi:hypothetical protein